MNLIKKALPLLLIFFSFTVSAESFYSAQDILCKTQIEETAKVAANLTSQDVVDKNMIKSIIKSINACQSQFIINNNPHNHLYYTFGEPYKLATNVALGIHNYAVKHFLGSVNLVLPAGSKINIETLEFTPATESEGNTKNNTVLLAARIIYKFFNYLALFYIFFSITVFVINSARGEISGDNIAKARRIILALSLVAPIPFYYDITMLQVITLTVISVGVMMANMLSVFLYFLVYSFDIETSVIAYKDNITGSAYEQVLNNKDYQLSYDYLINSQYILIKNLESDLKNNITKTTDIQPNQQLNFEENPNFFNCMFNYNFINSNQIYDIRKTATYNAINVCKSTHPYYYDSTGVKVNINFSDNYNKTGNYINSVFSPEQNELLKKVEKDTFNIAKKLYYTNCKYLIEFDHKSVINKTFDCVQFSDIGQYQTAFVEQSKKFDIVKTESNFNSAEYREEYRNDVLFKQTYYTDSIRKAKSLFLNEEDLDNYVETSIKNFTEKRLFSLMKAGYYGSYYILLPKTELNTNLNYEMFKGLLNLANPYSETEQDKINNIKAKYSEFSNIFYYAEIDNIYFNSGEDFFKDDYTSLLINDDYYKNNTLGKCIDTRECNYIMPTNLITHMYIGSSQLLDTALYSYIYNKVLSKLSRIYELQVAKPTRVIVLSQFLAGIIGVFLVALVFIVRHFSVLLEIIYRWIMAFLTFGLIIPKMFLIQKGIDENADFLATMEEQLVMKQIRELFFSTTIFVLATFLAVIMIYFGAIFLSYTVAIAFNNAEFFGIEQIDKYFVLLIYAVLNFIYVFYIMKRFSWIYNTVCNYFDVDEINYSEELQKIERKVAELLGNVTSIIR